MKLIVVNCKCYLVKSPNYFRATDLQKIRRYLLLKIKKNSICTNICQICLDMSNDLWKQKCSGAELEKLP